MPRLEHVGIAVADAPAVADLFEKLLGAAPYKAESVEREGVRTHFVAAGAAKLELLEALGPDSPVAKHLAKRGQGLHHLAFSVDDVDAAHARVRALGFTPLSDAPRPGADGKRIFFLHPKETAGVLVEFCGDDPEAALPAERVPFRDGTLAVYRRGDAAAPPLLVLHGAGGSTALETAPLVRRLETTRRVVALDFPAHGASDDAGPITADALADAAVAALDHAGIDRADVFGYSMGGYVALHLARRRPDRVRRLAVHAANPFWTDALVADMLGRLDLDALRRRAPAAADRLAAAHAAGWPRLRERLDAFVRALPATSPTDADLGAVSAPVLVSAGDADDLFPLALTLRLRDALPNARLAVLPGARHTLAHVDLDAYLPLLLAHLDG